jgi:hypothetical protein
MMFSSRERNRSSVPDSTVRGGFMTDSDPHRSEPENHVRKLREIPKILFLNLQAFQAKSPKPCKLDYFKTSKTSQKSTPPGVSHGEPNSHDEQGTAHSVRTAR